MNEEIKKGDIVKPIHCNRSQYMNKDFTEWIDKNSSSTFVVESKVNNVCRLRKVIFAITEEFLEKVK
jgi:hypothetical protein